MSNIQMTPDRYRKILSEYDTIFAHAREMSNHMAERLVVEKHLSYAETIFTKLVCHALSLRRLAPTLQPASQELWDIGALCAVARALVETPSAAPRAVNFGPDPASFCSVRQVVEAFSARFAGKPGWQRDGGTHPTEAQALTLSSALAERSLGWHPGLGIEDTLSWTADWYRAHAAGENMLDFTATQLDQFRDRTSRPS